MEVRGHIDGKVALVPENNPGTHCVVGWVDSRVCVDVLEERTYLAPIEIRAPNLPAPSIVAILSYPDS